MGDATKTEEPAAGSNGGVLVYIAGAPHSGSTILECLLSACDGTRGVGQFGRFYAHPDFDRCACGSPAASCPPCTTVRQAIRDDVGERRYRSLGRLTRREWGLPLLVASRALRRRYADASDRALRAMIQSDGRPVLIDSSKSISRGLALAESTSFDIRMIHCVRDPRGFVASREKRTQTRGRLRTVGRTWKWLLKNVLVAKVLLPRYPNSMTVRFEDLAADPSGVIGRVAAGVGLDPTAAVDGVNTGAEFHRTHLFEPPRQLDYQHVRFDAERSALPDTKGGTADLCWRVGGSFARRWGYQFDTTAEER